MSQSKRKLERRLEVFRRLDCEYEKRHLGVGLDQPAAEANPRFARALREIKAKKEAP